LVPPQEAAEVQQIARSFLDAVGTGDWQKVAELWPHGGKTVGDILDDQAKAALAGLKLVNLGAPFTKPGYPGAFVPYEIRFNNGEVKKWNLALRQDNPAGRWYWDGGL
jgi:hypothetical protein